MTDTLATDEDPLYLLGSFDADATSADEEDDSSASSLAMFEGDTSALFQEQRRCLHALLKHRYLSADRHPELWAVLLDNQDVIKSRLNELFFELHLDRDHLIAFKRQASTETGDPLPSLLRDVSHTKEESIVMVFLRQRFFAQRQEGEDIVFVDRQTLLDEVADQRPGHATHRAMDQKRALKAIDGLAAAGVILKTADPDRFRISPIIEVLLPIEKLRALWTWLMTQNGTAPESGDTGVDIEDELDLWSNIEKDHE